MKLKAELAIDPSYATVREFSTRSFKLAGQPLNVDTVETSQKVTARVVAVRNLSFKS